ncbi:HK97 family phage prohead protease [Nocardia sp. NPDC059180]|uniref:HK97 family phage prohead protease n=1 Tax=Nocardia sp. NPDC059180 TaxID=3346761 RepID=UPI0036816F99
MSATIHRSAATLAPGRTTVDIAQRILTVIAVPYGQFAQVPHEGEVWREVFEPGAFAGLDDTEPSVRVNRDHDKTRTVGKVVRFDPRDRRGLIADIRIAETPLGDETLQLAAEDMLSVSIGFRISSAGIRFDRRNKIRRVNRAQLDHIALVESPAYDGAKVLSVRNGPSSTPNLDEVLADGFLDEVNTYITRRKTDPRNSVDYWRNDPTLAWAQRQAGCRCVCECDCAERERERLRRYGTAQRNARR